MWGGEEGEWGLRCVLCGGGGGRGVGVKVCGWEEGECGLRCCVGGGGGAGSGG